MAPSKKGSKRVAVEAPAEVAPAKRLNDLIKQRGVSKRNYTLMVEALEHPLADISAECRSMLVAVLPQSLLVPVEDRHEVQASVIKMMQEVFEGIKNKLEAAAAVTKDRLTASEAEKAGFDSAVAEAQTAANLKAETTATLKAELADAAKAVLAAKAEVRKKEQEHSAAEEEFKLIEAEKNLFASVLAEDFAKLRDGACEGDDAQRHFENLKTIVLKLNMDDSFLTALPSMLKRPSERGSFDTVVVTQLGEALAKKDAETAADLASRLPAAAERAEAINAARQVAEVAKEAQHKGASALSAAQAEQAAAEAALNDATAALKAFMVQHKEIIEADNEAAANFELFVNHTLTCYNKLRDRTAIKEAEVIVPPESIPEASVMGA